KGERDDEQGGELLPHAARQPLLHRGEDGVQHRDADQPGDVGAQRDDDGDAEQQDDRGGALLFRIEEAHCDRVGPTGWARQALASCGLHERAVTSGPMDPTPAGLIMKKGVVIALLGILCVAPQAVSQQKTVTGKVPSEQGAPLSGRVAGIDVTSTSGVPGASSSIIIRGVSSISSSNQPLIILDGLPVDNRTVNTGVLASDKSSTTAFSNRGVDFTNRAADLNSQDIETVTVLKGPEAAALYGIDAANGALVIKTKRGRAGGGMQYSSSMRIERTSANYRLQRVYGPTTVTGSTLGSFQYFGAPYPAGTQFYDNIDGFLRTGLSQNHNLSFSGATTDNTINYRL